MLNKEIRSRIINLRESRNITITQLAKQIGIDVTALSKIEHGRRQISAIELANIAIALHVSTDYLLGINVIHASHTHTHVDLALAIQDQNPIITYHGKAIDPVDWKIIELLLSKK